MDLFVLSASLGLDITNFEGGIDAARRLLMQFAGAVVDFGKDVIETGMGFDKQMSAVQAVMGLTENTAENMKTMNGLREYALEQARDSIFTAEETATAYYYMGMAGWRAEQMTAGLPGIMALAAASGEDLKMTSDMVTDSLTAFGLGAGQASHFADVLAVTATNANTDVARMQQTFKYLAPIAGSLGYSIEDVALSVGLLANSGIKGSLAGTALRNIFTRIATNAGQTTEGLGALDIVTQQLGVSFYTAEGRARPWGEVLTDLREAWRKLDPKKVDTVTAAFGEFSAESQSADEVMSDFANDLDTWTTEWNNLSTAVEREEFASKLEPQFSVLGISMRDSNNNLREFSAVAQDARVKLGGLTDEEQIYYGKQISSLRGISGWLSLMTSSEKDVRQLTTAIENADGAAKAMADTRLDNLWGDTVRFNAALDVLKVAIHDDVKGPLRDIVQYSTDALNRITDSVNEKGLTGGIEQLGTEIKNMSEYMGPMLRSVGEAFTPVVSAMIDSLLDSAGGITNIAMDIGAGLFDGIMHGIAVRTQDNKTARRLFQNLLGFDLNDFMNFSDEDISKITVGVDVTPESVEQAIAEADAIGSTEIIVDGVHMTPTEARAYVEELQRMTSEGIDGGAESISPTLLKAVNVVAPLISSTLAEKIGEAGATGGEDMAGNLTGKFESANGVIHSGLVGSFGSAGVEGGTKLANNVSGKVIDKSWTLKSTLASALGSAGSDAGSTIVSAIQRAISVARFTANIIASVSSFFSGGTEKHAKSMYGGTILRGATIFGVNRDGKPLVGGESGPEAIVGVNSLAQMISDAVNNGMRNYTAVQNVSVSQQPMYLVLNGKVVGRVMAGDNANATAEYNRSIAVGYGG